MLCTKLTDGSYLVSDMIQGQYVKRIYQGYNKAQVIRLFRAYKKQLQQSWAEYLAK